jgi:flagellar basal-body rod protein FlgG
MMRALYSAASGMTAQQINVDNIANNLANANTNGYKTRKAQFQDLLYQNLVTPGAFSQGTFQHTDNPLDMVIQGRGFFQVRKPTGEIAYTRAGSFQLNKDGNVVTSDGDPLEPSITIPPGAQSISIAPDGTVSYTLQGQTASQQAGQIQLADFQNPAGLNSVGRNLYLPTDASGDAVVATPGGTEGLGTIQQGYTEGSNVSVVDEFINLITAQRTYEANSKVVTAADQMYQTVNQLVR